MSVHASKIISALLIPFFWIGLAHSDAIVNPSFEDDGEAFFINNTIPQRNPIGWTYTGTNPVFGLNTKTTTPTGATDGDFSLQFFTPASTGTYTRPDSISLVQEVDFTDIDQIMFDALTLALPGGSWDSFIRASFSIGGVQRWSTQSSGSFLDQVVDTSSITSIQPIEISLEVLSPGTTTTANNFWIDNIRPIPVSEPSTLYLVAFALISIFGLRKGLLESA